MIGFFFDTETTGLPDFKAPSIAVHQPHLVQVAGILVDLESKEELNSFELIVAPLEWEISEEVSKVHGITHEHAMKVGVREADVLDVCMDMWSKSGLRIAHNEPFDAKLLSIAISRYKDEQVLELWKEGAAFCTANKSRDLVKIPPTPKMVKAGFKSYKTPKLSESYEFFFNKSFENAHTALADARACMEVYFAIKERNNETQ